MEENVVCSQNISWAAELRQREACGYRAVKSTAGEPSLQEEGEAASSQESEDG